MKKIILAMMCSAVGFPPLANAVTPLPEKVTCAIADKQAFQVPDCVHLTGWIGSRIEANEKTYSRRTGNVLVEGDWSWSRGEYPDGSINDEDVKSFIVSRYNKPATEDWFAVTLDEPQTIVRVRYAHGKTAPDGGWFDASAGKPRIQIQTTKGGEWQDAGELKDYPATTATSAATLRDGEMFTCQLAAPVKVIGVRVVGKPAGGNNPNQAYSSCAELQAFEK